MRTIKTLSSAALFAAAMLAASITGAQANLTLPVDQETGTLSCQIRSAAGRGAAAPVADCTYVSDYNETKERYVALLGGSAVKAEAFNPGAISWRVTTRRGVERPGMLAGLFSKPADWFAAPSKTVSLSLLGRTASLSPIAQPGRATPVPMKAISGIELIATSTVASR